MVHKWLRWHTKSKKVAALWFVAPTSIHAGSSSSSLSMLRMSERRLTGISHIYARKVRG